MASTNHPGFAIDLPSTTLTFPAKMTASTCNPAQDVTRPSLKIKLIPHVLVPGSLISKHITGKKLESCVDVVVPVGGKVRVKVQVNEETIQLVKGHHADAMQARELKEMLLQRVSLSFNNAAEFLGLSSISIVDVFPHLQETTSELDRPQSAVDMYLTPVTASPAFNPLSNNLCHPSMPTVHLTALHLALYWARPGQNRISNAQAHSNSPIESQNSSTSTEDDDDMLCDDEGDDLPISGKDPASALDCSEGSIPLGTSHVIPLWVLNQLDIGLAKVMRLYMIKRFPLIFDKGLTQYSRALALPRAIPSSITRFLSLTAAHNPQGVEPFKSLLRDLTCAQEAFLKLKVSQAVNLPVKKVRANKRQRREEINGPSSHLQREAECSDKVSEYLAARWVSQNGEVDTEDMRLGTILEQAMGRIGRQTWEEKRKGRGKLAWYRVPLDVGNSSSPTIGTNSSPHIPPKSDTVPHCAHSPITPSTTMESNLVTLADVGERVVEDDFIWDDEDTVEVELGRGELSGSVAATNSAPAMAMASDYEADSLPTISCSEAGNEDSDQELIFDDGEMMGDHGGREWLTIALEDVVTTPTRSTLYVSGKQAHKIKDFSSIDYNDDLLDDDDDLIFDDE